MLERNKIQVIVSGMSIDREQSKNDFTEEVNNFLASNRIVSVQYEVVLTSVDDPVYTAFITIERWK